MEFKQFRRKQIAELADWHPGFDMTGVSVSDADKAAGSPKTGDKIARNPVNHADRWLVAADYFADNFEPAEPQRIRSAKRPEPVAWEFVMDGVKQIMFDEDADIHLRRNGKPLYGPEVLAYADRMRAERDAATRQCKLEQETTNIALARADSLASQLSALQRKYDAVVALTRRASGSIGSFDTKLQAHYEELLRQVEWRE